MEQNNQLIRIKSGLLDIVNSTNKNKEIEYIKFQKTLTLEGAILTNNFLSKFTGDLEPMALTTIQELLDNLQGSFNIDNKLSLTQKYEIGTLVVEKYGHLITLEEVALVFKKAKLSEYGKIFNRIDIQIIFEWFDKYLQSEDKQGFYERYNKKEHKQINVLDFVGKAPKEHLTELKKSLNKMIADDRDKNWQRSSVHNQKREAARVESETRYKGILLKLSDEELSNELKFNESYKNVLEINFINEEINKRNNGKN